MMNRSSNVALMGVVCFSFLLAEPATVDSIAKDASIGLKCDFALFDFPYQTDAAKTVNNGKATLTGFLKGYANPSMTQSLMLTTSFENTVHFYAERFAAQVGKRFPAMQKSALWVTLSLLDGVLAVAPPGDGWLHEEYHRAVMTRHHVNSFDDMNTFPIMSDMVSVKEVTDADLIRFKKESPADFVRMHADGIEGEYLLINELQKDNFFFERERPHEILYIYITLNAISYVNLSSIPKEVDSTTDEFNRVENTMRERDFTGFDFTAWAYDLFRPLEPYEARGIHPLGTGIDRYIKTTDLTDEELSYLKTQGKLQLLNCLSPMLFFKRSLQLKSGLKFNFAVRDFLTTFGNDISLTTFFRMDSLRFSFAYHHYRNQHHSFPALEGSLIEHPVTVGSCRLLLSPRVIAGVQPRNQSFTTRTPAFLGLAECRTDVVTASPVWPWISIALKTPGWVAGNVFIEDNVSVQSGISLRF